MMRDVSNSAQKKHGCSTPAGRRESEARLDRIAGIGSAMAICQARWRSDGSLTWPFMSNRCSELLEVSAEAIQADANILLRMIHREDIWEFNQSLTRSMSSLQSWHWQGRFMLPSGKVKWMQLVASPEKMANGEILWDGLLLDITDCQQVGEERDRLFDLSLDILVIVGVDGCFKRVNRAVTRILGYSGAEVIDRQLIDFVHPEDRAATIAKVSDLSQGKQIAEFENRYRCKDGSYKWLCWRGVRVASADLIYAVAHDITDRKGTELTLKKLSEELEIRVAERTTELGYTNSILLEEIGDRKRAESALRASEARLIEQKEQLEKAMTELAYTNSILVEEIGDRRRAESALRASEARLIEQKEQLEKTLEELQQAQVHLVNSEKMSSLGQLVAGVAHEINNPVGFISGNLFYVKGYVQDLLKHLRLYQQHYPNPTAEIIDNAAEIDVEFMTDDLMKMLSSMKMGTDRIEQISISLRNFSRSDQSSKAHFNIHEGIDSTLLILKHRLKATKNRPEIKLIQEYGELPLVECYPGQLNQVFMNLLANAIDALEEDNNQRQGTIRIRTEVIDDNWVAIYIADNGPGMTPEVQQQLFNALFTTKAVGKGTGLGLSISYSIVVEKHGGKLSCKSAPGQGAEFAIELPIRTLG